MADSSLPAVKSSVTHSAEALDLSVWHLMASADIVVQGVLLLLVLASLISWSIIFDKTRRFKHNTQRIEKFERVFGNASSLPELYAQLGGKADSPMTAMFNAAMREAENTDSSVNLVDRIEVAVMRNKNSGIRFLEHKLSFLATTASSAPFIGLFGTVWGIVGSFQAIAASNNTSLAVVAPGIAEALIATGIGLFAAIPALIFYNIFSQNIRRTAARLDDFANALLLLVPQVDMSPKAKKKRS